MTSITDDGHYLGVHVEDESELQALVRTSLGLDQDPAIVAAYAATGQRPGAVGYDEQDRLVERQLDGSLKPLDSTS